MLAFFRKYEKTFLLVIFAPALISLGITGVMVSAMERDPADDTAGTVFGESYSHRQLQELKQQLQVGNPRPIDDDYAWRFLAALRAAEAAGIHVSDDELRGDIKEKFRWQIAQHKAQKEFEALKIDPFRSQEGREKWQEIFSKYMADDSWDEAAYQEILKTQGTLPRRYEEQLRRTMMITRYSDAVRDLAAVEVDEVWKKFQEEHHLRVAELISVAATDFTPDLAVTDSSSKHFVSPEQVKAHYLAHKDGFDEPRRVDTEFVAAPLSAVKLGLKGEQVDGYYAANKHEFVARIESGLPVYKPLDDVRSEVEEKVALEQVDQALEEVLVRAAAAKKGDQAVDLAAITSSVMKDLDAPWLTHGDAGWVSRDDLPEHEQLAGFSAENWIERVEDTTKVSDALAGEKAWFVLRAKGVRAARTPSYEELEGRVRDEYANGSRAERKQYFISHPQEFRRPDRFDVELLSATDEAFGGREAARKTLEAFLADPETRESWRQSTSKIEGALKLEKTTLEQQTTDTLKDHALLGDLALEISFAKRGDSGKVTVAKDGKGLVMWRVVATRPAEMPKLAEVESEVAAKVALERALDRAESWVNEQLLVKLRHKTGEPLKQALAELGLVCVKTEPFTRTTTTLEKVPEGGAVVGKAFEAAAVVDGPFEEVIRDMRGKQLLIMRVAEKKDAPEAEFAKVYDALRRDLVKNARIALSQRRGTELLLEAKQLTEAHQKYAREVRDGPNGEVSLKVRQIYLAPDKDTIDSWLKARAAERIEEARKELAQGTKTWDQAVAYYSEDLPSKDRGGVLAPVKPGDLMESYGDEFEGAVWSLPMVDPNAPVTSPPQPITSSEGLHLVQKVGLEGGLTRFRHLLVKTDADTRKLPDDIRKQADDVARRAMEEAAKRLAAGEPFALVADEVGDDLDPYSRGQELVLDWTTPFERTAFDQPLEWSQSEDGENEDPRWMPPAVQVGQEWHWFACERDRFSREQGGGREQRSDREVCHMQLGSQGDAEAVKKKMLAFLDDYMDDNDGDRPGWVHIKEKFQELARDWSKAPDAKKGGAIGLFRLATTSDADADQVRPYGDEFLRRITVKEDGTPTAAGHRAGPFRGATGWHIVEVVEVTKKPADDLQRNTDVCDELLFGTDWR